ncbi:hypothetical protein [Pseudomonas putida]|uniref:Uncharacterized protein n=1 Tax=Pseudomonas putida TaxID=303 RepID=A0A6I6XSN8_PSEPU|nr:hypothetical protein [Pseudomonas putida]QHG64385.2 hypothetical protein C2H86_08160 [Pseudomonas putida]
MAIKEVLQSWLESIKSLWTSNYASPVEEKRREFDDIRKVNAALLPLLLLGFGAVIAVGWRASAVGPMLLWAMACLAVGATVGFLFGIPRSGASMAGRNGANAPVKQDIRKGAFQPEVETGRPNTNLEEVSDWLTKILVGLSLVHLKEIEERVSLISFKAAASLSSTPSNFDISAATALVIGFPVVGFLGGYLYTRLFLQGAFIRSNNEMFKWHEVVAAELSHVSPVSLSGSDQPSVPTLTDRQAAERILQVAPTDRPNELLAPLQSLASDYEKARHEMPPGDSRTRKMAEIASSMKKLALATAPFLPQLTQSPSPGERLAAVIILQMKFDPVYIEWLANRLFEEPAFAGYQAASALLTRMAVVGDPERQRIKSAVAAAMKKRSDLGLESKEGWNSLVAQIMEA